MFSRSDLEDVVKKEIIQTYKDCNHNIFAALRDGLSERIRLKVAELYPIESQDLLPVFQCNVSDRVNKSGPCRVIDVSMRIDVEVIIEGPLDHGKN